MKKKNTYRKIGNFDLQDFLVNKKFLFFLPHDCGNSLHMDKSLKGKSSLSTTNREGNVFIGICHSVHRRSTSEGGLHLKGSLHLKLGSASDGGLYLELGSAYEGGLYLKLGPASEGESVSEGCMDLKGVYI